MYLALVWCIWHYFDNLSLQYYVMFHVTCLTCMSFLFDEYCCVFMAFSFFLMSWVASFGFYYKGFLTIYKCSATSLDLVLITCILLMVNIVSVFGYWVPGIISDIARIQPTVENWMQQLKLCSVWKICKCHYSCVKHGLSVFSIILLAYSAWSLGVFLFIAQWRRTPWQDIYPSRPVAVFIACSLKVFSLWDIQHIGALP